MPTATTQSWSTKILSSEKELIGRCLLTLILSQCLTLAFLFHSENTSTKVILLTLAVSTVFCSYLLYPGKYFDHRSKSTINLIWTGLLAIGFVVLTFANNIQINFSQIIRLTFAVIIFSLLLSCLTRFINRLSNFSSAYSRAPILVFLMITTLTTAPIWASTWIEDSNHSPGFVIAISPLSYLSTMFDYDYLRSQWFYTHTPYGTLRYHYPHWVSYLIVYLGISVLLLIAEKQLKFTAQKNSRHK